MARMVGEQGIVHAADLQQPLIDEVHNRAQDAGILDRIVLHCAGAYNLPLPDDSCDLAVLIATLPQVPDRMAALLEVRRVLKPGARLAISEELPDPAYTPARVVRSWAEAAGFEFAVKNGNPFCYNLVFTNAKTADVEIVG
jgi:ubiquinone/menaquinone biosynthesis C-methylase UbiE